ncbi:MAG: hypothetical protein Q8K63_06260 [Acidimicrobiales bacterium]|nr:hypothetical protein [Acidimicrobiales bacterium]
MANVKVELKLAGIRVLLKEPGVLNDLERRARKIAAAAGSGHGVRSEIGRRRARAAIVTETTTAARREATDRNLTSSIDAAR